MPFGIADGELVEVEAGDFARGEDDEEAAVCEVVGGAFHGGDVVLRGVRDDVDGDDAVVQFGDGGEHVVGEEFDIGSDAVEDLHEHGAFEETGGVVEDEDCWT